MDVRGKHIDRWMGQFSRGKITRIYLNVYLPIFVEFYTMYSLEK